MVLCQLFSLQTLGVTALKPRRQELFLVLLVQSHIMEQLTRIFGTDQANKIQLSLIGVQNS